MSCILGFIYLDWQIASWGLILPLLLSHSVVSACLPSLSLRNLLTCPVATSFAEHAGRGMLYLGLACGLAWDALNFLTLIYFSVCCCSNVCMPPQVSQSKDPRGWSPQHLLPSLRLLSASPCGSHRECGLSRDGQALPPVWHQGREIKEMEA